MYLKFKGVVKGARANMRLTTDSDKAFPKGKKSVSRMGTVNGEPVEFRITGSAVYAVRADAGYNGWLKWEGKVRWFLFDAKVDALKLPLDFVSGDGGETPNPVRAPKRGDALEAERRAKFSATYAERHGNADRSYSGEPDVEPTPEPTPEGEVAPTE